MKNNFEFRKPHAPEDEKHIKIVVDELESLGVTSEDLGKIPSLLIGEKISGNVGRMKWEVVRNSEQDFSVLTNGAENADIAKAKEYKDTKFAGLTESERAQAYWDAKLGNETRIAQPQHPECDFAFVVPVYNESPNRILRQLASLENQKNIDPKTFEVIYVVNNDIPNANSKTTAAIEANQAVLKTLRNLENISFPVHIIDKSSPGNEIQDCNVGRARNRGVAEASIRFYENQKNGTLIQTDADTYFNDPEYLYKVQQLLKEDPDIIGIAGGIYFEFDPDTADDKELSQLKKKMRRFVLKQKWDRLINFLNGEKYTGREDTHFSGAHMISKSYESAVIGGLIDANSGEDPQFGEDLQTYASGRGQKIKGMRQELFVTTALRASDRTAASFKKDFDMIDLERPFRIPDPIAPDKMPEFRNHVENILESNPLNEAELTQLLSDSSGKLMVSNEALQSLITHIKEKGYTGNDIFYRQWIDENFSKDFDLIRSLYDAVHPQLLLNEENYQILVSKVLEKPGGAEIVQDLDTMTLHIK